MKILTRYLLPILSLVVCLISQGVYAIEPTAPAMAKEQNATTLDQLEAHIGKYPRNAQAKFQRATQLAYLERDAEAIRAFQALIQQYPELPESYNNLAVLYAKHGQHAEAQATLEAALRANPNYARAYQNLGLTHLQLAATAYQRAAKLNSRDKFSAQRQQQIQAILAPSFSTLPYSKRKPMIELTTNYGVIKLKLDADKAPKTVENFLNYVKKGHYDNTVFHRVIPGFMVQGGGFTEDMQQKPTAETITNEADNGLKNMRGTIAMARTQAPHSASAQFFINLADNDFLNFSAPTLQGWGYCVFGSVVEGLDVIDKIAQVKTGSHSGHQDVPREPVVIQKARLID